MVDDRDMSKLLWFFGYPQILFTFGMFIIFMGMVMTWNGRVLDRSFGYVDRDKDPKGFWSGIAMYYLGGLCFIAFYLFEIRAF